MIRLGKKQLQSENKSNTGRMEEARKGIQQRVRINKCDPIPKELLEGTVIETTNTTAPKQGKSHFEIKTLEKQKNNDKKPYGYVMLKNT